MAATMSAVSSTTVTAPATSSSPSGAKPQPHADAVEPICDGAGHILGTVPHHHGVVGGQISQGGSNDVRFADRTLCGDLVIRGSPDRLEQAGDAVVLQHDLRQPFGLLGCDGHGPARFRKSLQHGLDPGVQAALRDARRQVVLPV